MEPSQTPARHLPKMLFASAGTGGQSDASFQPSGYGLAPPSSAVASRYRSRQEPVSSPYRGPASTPQKDAGGPPAVSLMTQMEPTHIMDTNPQATPSSTARARSSMEDEAGQTPGRWVTVFGFSPLMTEVVLQHFHSCGEIIRVRHAPNQGNWMHIMFQTTLQAQKALGKSGKIIQGNLMIGVVPCTDESALSELLDAAPTPVFAPDTSKPFVGASTEYSVDPTLAGRTPRAERGFWSKVSEYIIGV